MVVFLAVLNKTVTMMVLLALGYLLRRRGAVSDKAARDLGALETKLILPTYIFITLARAATPDKMAGNAKLISLGVALIAFMILTASVASKIFPGSRVEKIVFYYILVFPNFGYFGYPVVRAAFGEEGLAQYVLFALPFTIGIYTYGAYLLTSKREQIPGKRGSFLASFRSLPIPVLVAVILGLAVGLLRIPLPAMVTDFFDFTSACMSPLSMVLAGFILAALPLPKLFCSGKGYVISIIKLIIQPALVCGVAYLCGLRGFELIFPTLLAATPVGMNTVIFSKPENEDYTSTVVTCFTSYLIGLITVPLVIALASLIA